MEGADVVHVGVDVGVRRVKGRLRPHRGVPLGRDPDEGNVGKGRTAREAGRPGKQEAEDGEKKCAKSQKREERSIIVLQ